MVEDTIGLIKDNGVILILVPVILYFLVHLLHHSDSFDFFGNEVHPGDFEKENSEIQAHLREYIEHMSQVPAGMPTVSYYDGNLISRSADVEVYHSPEIQSVPEQDFECDYCKAVWHYHNGGCEQCGAPMPEAKRRTPTMYITRG